MFVNHVWDGGVAHFLSKNVMEVLLKRIWGTRKPAH